MCKARKKTKPSKTTLVPKAQVKRAMEDLAERLAEDDWTELKPTVFVALAAWMHSEVYGVDVEAELRPQWKAALGAVGRMLREEFDGNAEAMLAFVKWTWAREMEREEWRRKNGAPGARLTWRRVYAQRGVLSDWRVELARKNGVK
jgi:hypothetical protein